MLVGGFLLRHSKDSAHGLAFKGPGLYTIIQNHSLRENVRDGYFSFNFLSESAVVGFKSHLL